MGQHAGQKTILLFSLLRRLQSQNQSISLDSPYRKAITGAILKMQEEGKLHQLKTTWWKEKGGGGKCIFVVVLSSDCGEYLLVLGKFYDLFAVGRFQ